MLFYLSFFAFKNFTKSTIRTDLRQCHDTPCIVNDGRLMFLYFFVNGALFRRKAAFKVFPMLKHESFQSRLLSMGNTNVCDKKNYKPSYVLGFQVWSWVFKSWVYHHATTAGGGDDHCLPTAAWRIDLDPTLFFTLSSTSTRSHQWKISKPEAVTWIRQNSFAVRVVNDWNALPKM